MAIQLLGATNDRIDLGDIAWSTRGVITVAVTFNASGGIATSARVASQWSATAGDKAILMRFADTDELGFIVQGASGTYGRKTSTQNFATGTTYRVVAKWRGSSDGGPSIQMFVNGTEPSLIQDSASDSFATFNDSGSAFQFGHETSETIDGIDADFSEMAVWSSYLPDGACMAISQGYSPAFYRNQSGVFYVPAIRNIVDVWGGRTITSTTTGVSAHPSVWYPSAPQTRKWTTTTATSAWGPLIASHHNRLVIT